MRCGGAHTSAYRKLFVEAGLAEVVAAGCRDRILEDVAAEQASKVAQRLLMPTGLYLTAHSQ